LPTDRTPFSLVFHPVAELKNAKNPIHLDLVAESAERQREFVDRYLELGARRIDIGQGPDADHVVLADPEGNEFCVVVRGTFLADTGFVGAVVFEPADPPTGSFWGEAIGWPVVFDEDGDVAIRARDGRGPFITFGPPSTVARQKSRIRLELAVDPEDDPAAEIDRLIALGAGRIDSEGSNVAGVVLADPDGNEFVVLTEP
jgi:Glyoxalase-like domain